MDGDEKDDMVRSYSRIDIHVRKKWKREIEIGNLRWDSWSCSTSLEACRADKCLVTGATCSSNQGEIKSRVSLGDEWGGKRTYLGICSFVM